MNSDTIRQLIKNCRDKKMRTLGFPRVWQPFQIENPEYPGHTFTDISAWEFIAGKLESGHEYEELIMNKPKGALALVMKIILPSTKILYIKVEVGPRNNAIGRSFHISEY